MRTARPSSLVSPRPRGFPATPRLRTRLASEDSSRGGPELRNTVPSGALLPEVPGRSWVCTYPTTASTYEPDWLYRGTPCTGERREHAVPVFDASLRPHGWRQRSCLIGCLACFPISGSAGCVAGCVTSCSPCLPHQPLLQFRVGATVRLCLDMSGWRSGSQIGAGVVPCLEQDVSAKPSLQVQLAVMRKFSGCDLAARLCS